jgi:hypothetical protein
MLAHVTSPALPSAFNFGFLRESRAAEKDHVARVIAESHHALVQRGAPRGAAAAAKRKLIAVLERTKGMRLPCMTVPPIGDSPADSRTKGLRRRRRRSKRLLAPPPARDPVLAPARARELVTSLHRRPPAGTTLKFYDHNNHT